MSDIEDDSSAQPPAWSTRTLVASAIAAVVLGLGAGAAIVSAGDGAGSSGKRREALLSLDRAPGYETLSAREPRRERQGSR